MRLNPDAWGDDWDELEFRHWKDKQTRMSLEEEEALFDDFYNNEKVNSDPDYTQKIYSQRDFDYRFERELIRAEREFKERENTLKRKLSESQDTIIQMAAKLKKVEKMEALLNRYALHSEIDYDKETYEFINYDERS